MKKIKKGMLNTIYPIEKHKAFLGNNDFNRGRYLFKTEKLHTDYQISKEPQFSETIMLKMPFDNGTSLWKKIKTRPT